MHNLTRIRPLWPLVTQFLLPVANHRTARIRIIGIEALNQIVLAAMRHAETPADAPRAPTAQAAAAAAAAAALPARSGGRSSPSPLGPPPRDVSWERLLLTPLEELQRRCAHRETQERIIQAVHQVLHASAGAVGDGWPLVLSMLYRAATRPALSPLLPLAIRSVQLIAQVEPCPPTSTLLSHISPPYCPP